MKISYWIVKSDPSSYSWEQFLKDKTTIWDGVRNYQARNNLALIKLKDKVLFYHSVEDKSIIGIAEVSETSFPDPKDNEGRWLAVKLKVDKSFKNPVTLDQIKNHPLLKNSSFLKQPRLSVLPLTQDEFKAIIDLSK